MQKTILIIITIAAIIYLLFSMLTINVGINKYDTLQTAREQNATINGWIPEILPASAYDISESHEPKKREVFGLFHYKEVDEAAFLSKLAKSKEYNQTMVWGDFLFHVDKEKNIVKFRNRPATTK